MSQVQLQAIEVKPEAPELSGETELAFVARISGVPCVCCQTYLYSTEYKVVLDISIIHRNWELLQQLVWTALGHRCAELDTVCNPFRHQAESGFDRSLCWVQNDESHAIMAS